MKLPGASDMAASFEFGEEDHTLGNALRYMIMKKCGGISGQVDMQLISI